MGDRELHQADCARRGGFGLGVPRWSAVASRADCRNAVAILHMPPKNPNLFSIARTGSETTAAPVGTGCCGESNGSDASPSTTPPDGSPRGGPSYWNNYV